MPKYGYRTYSVNSKYGDYWVAESTQLKGCIGEGGTEKEAVRELSGNEEEWVSTAKEMGIPVPKPIS